MSESEQQALRDDELVLKATIPAAAGATAIIVVMTTFDSITVTFNDDGEMCSPSWPVPGVILPVIPYGKLYRFVFNSPDVDDFFVVSPGVGGGIANINGLECFAFEQKYSRAGSASFSEVENVSAVPQHRKAE